MPTVIATDSDIIPARRGPRDANSDGVRLAARTRKSYHVSPRMDLDQPFGEIDLLGTIERRHIAGGDGFMDGGIDLRMTVAERVRPDAHQRHVGVAIPIHIPDLAALRFTEIGRPPVG